MTQTGDRSDVRRSRTSGATARDRAANALVLGIAAMAWFGWAQEGPPASWLPVLTAGSAVAVLVTIAAGVLTYRHRAGRSAMDDPRGRTAYLRVVGVELGCIALGAVALGTTGHAAYLSPWILLVVGVHFLPLGTLFRLDGLRVCGVLVSVVAVVAALVGWAGDLLPSALAGGVGGLVMVAFGIHSLHRGWRDQRSSRAPVGEAVR